MESDDTNTLQRTCALELYITVLFRGDGFQSAMSTDSARSSDPPTQNVAASTPSPGLRKARLEEVEREGRPPFYLTYTELKLLGIAGVS